MISTDMLCVCVCHWHCREKTNYLFGFQENMFILLILCALKGQGHEFPENVSEGCPSLSLVLLLFSSFFFSRGGHKIKEDRVNHVRQPL
jgi:hypothetical protein